MQKIVETTLGDAGQLAKEGVLPTPSIIVVGKASLLREQLAWYADELKVNPIG